jgi:hypothetical protein
MQRSTWFFQRGRGAALLQCKLGSARCKRTTPPAYLANLVALYDCSCSLCRVPVVSEALPGSKMTMMKKKMATNLASATATLKPETRMENMKMGHMRGVIDYRGWNSSGSPTGFRLLQRSAPSVVEHKKRRRKRRLPEVKKRGLYDSSAAGEKVRAGRRSYLPTALHP